MKHIIVGGDGFVGRYIARDLLKKKEQVLVCDIRKSPIPIYEKATFMKCDITDNRAVREIPFQPEDIVYNVAARMLHPIIKRKDRHDYFFSVDYDGAKLVLDAAMDNGCNRLVQFSTDMVYGRLKYPPPIREDHPREPIGEYSDSKRFIEDYCISKRQEGLQVSIFRPRLIIGPSRLGILTNLFKLIRWNLPIPLIGNGSNHYQMISVFDCASAAVKSAERNVVDGEFNLGSENPPQVRDLLRGLAKQVGSKSILVPTPAPLVKSVLRLLDRINLPLLVPEQFEIADADYVIDIEHTKSALGWRPEYDDTSMFSQAYDDYVNGRESQTAF
ncbi:MAG: NAD(P)-dependent oxidoreductase [Gammaproteobacteria bacterium]|nr:NAD(P)-dependent oxidoreductase [Gammaproteobacteria bacterium]MDH4315111.1 NAD(P)-dependent oxidoreductase [Gammaproteobacteria bacterium]